MVNEDEAHENQYKLKGKMKLNFLARKAVAIIIHRIPTLPKYTSCFKFLIVPYM